MLDICVSRARNIWTRIMNLLHGRLVRHDELATEIISLNEKIEIELDARIQQVNINQLYQVNTVNLNIEMLHKRVDEQFQRVESRLDFLQDLLRQQVHLVSPGIDGFEQSLRHELIEALLSEFVDNFDPYCGAATEAIQQEINGAIAYYQQNFDERVDLLIDKLPMLELDKLYFHLSDTESKKLLTKLITFRLLGLTKVRLRSSEDAELDRIFYNKLNDLISIEYPPYKSGSFEVPCYDLRHIGLTFSCHTIPFAINTEFRNRQYANDLVYVRQGDRVLDCGACWGDTSLWFAEQAGPTGRVFSFEFVPSALEIFNANLALNPELSERIELVVHPVAECSGKIIRCQDNGAASTFKIEQMEDPNASSVEAVTVSIDDWVNRHNLQKVDFIKMDIEGAELDALSGAIQTLKRFRPRLAIALYHRPEDIYQIPDFLERLDLGYRYYLKHPTAAGFETVLLALCD